MDLTKGIFRNNIDSIDYLLIKGIETQLKKDLFYHQAQLREAIFNPRHTKFGNKSA